MLQKLRMSNKKGFTLIELMIVIAIIGILAAIAVPQFLSYRTRSYNTAAKAVANNLKSDNGNLNAELGVFGHTEGANATLGAADGGVAIADTLADPLLAVTATPGNAGARLVGTTNDGTRVMAVGISLGNNMFAFVQDVNDANDNSTYTAGARHDKGDTAYAIDSDIENQLYSVSDPDNFPNAGAFTAALPAPAVATPPADDLLGVNGNGSAAAPNWTAVR